MMADKGIPDELIENIAKQNLKNIVDKVRSGKTLNRTELAMVDELKARGQEIEGVKGHPKVTKSNKAVVEIIQAEFGISERKSYDWLKALPTLKTSKGWQVEELLNEIDRRRKASGSSSTPEILELRKQKLQEEVWTIRAKRKEAEGELCNAKEEEKRFLAIWARTRKAVEDWRAHQTAKHPELSEIINTLADNFIQTVHDA